MGQPVFTEAAAAEFAAARRWYEIQRTGRGEAFASAVRHALDHLEHAAESFPIVFQRFRRILVRRYPYMLLFRIEADGVAVIHAVFHTSQNPASLRGRLRRS